MMTCVTFNTANGRSAVSTRSVTLATITFGAASHTMRSTGGIFFRAWSRSRQRGAGFEFAVISRAPLDSLAVARYSRPRNRIYARRGPRKSRANLLELRGLQNQAFDVLLFFFRPHRNFFIAQIRQSRFRVRRAQPASKGIYNTTFRRSSNSRLTRAVHLSCRNAHEFRRQTSHRAPAPCRAALRRGQWRFPCLRGSAHSR